MLFRSTRKSGNPSPKKLEKKGNCRLGLGMHGRVFGREPRRDAPGDSPPSKPIPVEETENGPVIIPIIADSLEVAGLSHLKAVGAERSRNGGGAGSGLKVGEPDLESRESDLNAFVLFHDSMLGYCIRV